MIAAAIITMTVATAYDAEVNTPLYCDRWHNDLRYHPDQAPFLAWPFDVAGGQCGDDILVTINDKKYWYKALDSGLFGKHCVIQSDGYCAPIAVDIPEFFAPFDGLSHVAKVVNVSEEWRKFNRRESR